MTKLIDLIEARLCNEKKAVPLLLEPNVTLNVAVGIEFDELQKYMVGVEWRSSVYCKPRDVPHMIDNTIRALREDIYGELRGNLLAIDRAIYEHDWHAVSTLIRKTINEAFG